MAKYDSIFSCFQGMGRGLSGKLGDRIYYNRNGKSYSRRIPVSIKNSRTPAQLANRAKFGTALKFIQPLKEFINIGFRLKAKNMSEFNYAMSFTLKNAITGVYPDAGIDYSKVVLSKGNLAGAYEPTIALIAPLEIEFTWQLNLNAYNFRFNDKVMVIVFNTDKQEAIVITNGNIRYIMRQLVKMPATFAGDEVVCYLAFHDYNEKEVSDSQFLGSLRVDEGVTEGEKERGGERVKG